MPWVRFDDQFPIHRKVRGLSDSAYRLHTDAIFWCARNLAEGHVPAEDLADLATARRPLKFVTELVARGCWHLAAEVCESEKCPAHPDNPPAKAGEGWLIHDYFDYQPTKARVLEEREKNAERQRRHRERQEAESRSVRNAVSNAVTNASVTRPRPVPSRRDGGSLGDHSAGDQSVRAGARTREAARWLTDRYRLTDDESAQVIAEVRARARAPIEHLVPYLSAMAEGDLADIANAAMDRGEQREQPSQPLVVVPDWCGGCDERTRMVEVGDDGRPMRCPDCNPGARLEAS